MHVNVYRNIRERERNKERTKMNERRGRESYLFFHKYLLVVYGMLCDFEVYDIFYTTLVIKNHIVIVFLFNNSYLFSIKILLIFIFHVSHILFILFFYEINLLDILSMLATSRFLIKLLKNI